MDWIKLNIMIRRLDGLLINDGLIVPGKNYTYIHNILYVCVCMCMYVYTYTYIHNILYVVYY